MKETSALHLLFGLPARGVRYALGYQMFGFREKTQQQTRSTAASSASSTVSAGSDGTGAGRDAGRDGRAIAGRATPTAITGVAGREVADALPTRGRVRLSGFGHIGMGGSLALCDPASGLAFAMTTNKVYRVFCAVVLFTR